MQECNTAVTFKVKTQMKDRSPILHTPPCNTATCVKILLWSKIAFQRNSVYRVRVKRGLCVCVVCVCYLCVVCVCVCCVCVCVLCVCVCVLCLCVCCVCIYIYIQNYLSSFRRYHLQRSLLSNIIRRMGTSTYENKPGIILFVYYSFGILFIECKLS
jgi:hypothetical protein